MISFKDILALGFLETQKKNIFWKLLKNYFTDVNDKIKDKLYAKNRFTVNNDYIKRIQINQRRYFTFDLNKKRKLPAISKDYSIDDQILITKKENLVGYSENSFDDMLQKSNNRKINDDDELLNKYLPICVKSK